MATETQKKGVKLDDFLKLNAPRGKESKLTPFKREINELRQNGYTLQQICAFLEENSVHISIAGLSKFIKSRENNTPAVNNSNTINNFVPKSTNLDPVSMAPKVKSDADQTQIQNQFVCLPLKPDVGSLGKREGVPPEVYMPGDMPHPFIDGLMLSMEARVYKAALEYEDINTGERHIESIPARTFRIKWTKPMKMVPSSTSGDFMKLDPSLFNKK